MGASTGAIGQVRRVLDLHAFDSFLRE